MTHPEKTLVAGAPIEDLAALGVVASGLLAVACPAGWQVAWLVVVGLAAMLRRWGVRWAPLLTPPPPQGRGAG